MKSLPPYSVITDNDYFIAVNKMSGISVGGDRWDESKERLDKILERDFKIPKVYTVHRIDKETSGLVIFAKDRETHRSLSIAFEHRQVTKKYTAIVHGRTAWKETVCDLALVPNGNKKHMTIIDKYQGKESFTRFVCMFSAGNFSVLSAYPETGRIHQIRVHLSALGHPVVCDDLYGKENPIKLSSFKRGWKGDPLDEKPLLARLGLHALELTLPDGQTLTAQMPRDISALIKQLEKLN
ncbi:MAG: RNA pseudouridine synthase [Treponema sp.]|jgi:RluA family pseudouridine synthase|nr:RNA pseudouridine synthase [Treponema sp.]